MLRCVGKTQLWQKKLICWPQPHCSAFWGIQHKLTSLRQKSKLLVKIMNHLSWNRRTVLPISEVWGNPAQFWIHLMPKEGLIFFKVQTARSSSSRDCCHFTAQGRRKVFWLGSPTSRFIFPCKVENFKSLYFRGSNYEDFYAKGAT